MNIRARVTKIKASVTKFVDRQLMPWAFERTAGASRLDNWINAQRLVRFIRRHHP